MVEDLKTGGEILDEYFKKLKDDKSINENLRMTIFTLWEQKKLGTKTSLMRALDELREKAK